MKIEMSAESFKNLVKVLPTYHNLKMPLLRDLQSEIESHMNTKIKTWVFVWLSTDLQWDYCICGQNELPIDLNSQVVYASRNLEYTVRFHNRLSLLIKTLLEEIDRKLTDLENQ